VSAPEICAIVVNYNAGAELRRALQSLADELSSVDWEAVVVDNASHDRSAEVVAEFAPRVRLVRNERNVGFARGVNQGLAATTAPFVLIMNPDCRLEPGAVASLRRELERSDACAMTGPRILDPNGSEQGNARGDPDMLTGLFGRTALLRRALPGLRVSRRNVIRGAAVRNDRASVEVDWLSGACMLARRAALHAVQGFDERYFLYWEDADVCRRLRNRGYEVRYVPGATAVHLVGQSSRSARGPAIQAFHESAYLYYATHVAARSWPRRLLARSLLSARCWWRLRGN
jgi:GT2 family glycosyltransferase